jgi:hypothetical protein
MTAKTPRTPRKEKENKGKCRKSLNPGDYLLIFYSCSFLGVLGVLAVHLIRGADEFALPVRPLLVV